MAKRLNIHPTHPEPRKILEVVDVLRRGGVIAYPTDTVYALGCDIRQKKAVDEVYRLKRMSKEHPVAFVCPDLGDLARFATVDDQTYRLMRRLLPGPYTFILPATREVPKILMMKRKTVGIRVPHHEVVLAIVRELGGPIVSTSAAFEGEQLNDPDDIMLRFKEADLVIDSGWGSLEPSTVLDLSDGKVQVVREGAGPVDGLI
ncbi:MAG: threonylcarbamoyl-AMP synthase [Myxococcales bacterium]|nr:threonylcarbamoyl-AMP synthase [Myxococcales bacterium]